MILILKNVFPIEKFDEIRRRAFEWVQRQNLDRKFLYNFVKLDEI